jgi:hypothetical protein
MHSDREITSEGLTEQEILGLSLGEVDVLILIGAPIVFRAGSATILGSFRKNSGRLVIELAQIEGGGEGVLLSMASLARRYSSLNGISEIEWIVRAISCAKPNLKLRRVLDRRGFSVEQVRGVGQAYHLIHPSDSRIISS